MWTTPPSLFADEVGDELDRTYRKFAINVYNNLQTLSPVDTGRYRRSHHISIGTKSLNENGGGVELVLGLPKHTYPLIYIQNNLPYALRLEHGWSQQAPTGVYGNAFNSTLGALG
ncbi:HK97 gp10 family phage protein [Moraxella catarrhalis]|uniref:HK97 gp10 family phage protein n=1 Tax=Moraxella catarrhalis TaxID=480 RepID=UPI0007E4308E|nr:HK97 gp10 family phage protein [Moraxella catarrhalis]DAR36303.1 MAG TPA: tail component [Caudoviricetes sp.]